MADWLWGFIHYLPNCPSFSNLLSEKVSKKMNYKFLKPCALNPEVMSWVSAFASCAIEGNSLAVEMIELWNNGQRDEFVKRLENWIGEDED